MRFDDGSLLIELLASRQDRAGFRCGDDRLDRYLRDQAGQDFRRRLSRTFVAVQVEQPTRILGYYTLSATSVAPGQVPDDVARRLPRIPVPAALIGRLAVAAEAARRGLGRILVADAVKRTLVASASVAIAVLVVDPIDDGARRFYAGFGFLPLHDTEGRMVLALPA